MNTILNREIRLIDLNLIGYKDAWDYQADLFEGILKAKAANRNARDAAQQPTPNYLIFCEHPHVFTLGKSGEEKNLLIDQQAMSSIGASYYHINRGGDITYHGPGQLVVYPVLDLENFFTDIHRYMRLLEEAVIQTLAAFKLVGGRIPGLTGVWLEAGSQNPGKICAMGVKTSRWVTMHGLALNVNTALNYFDYIVPCGIQDKRVTSMERELTRAVSLDRVKSVLKEKMVSLFDMKLVEVTA